MGFVLVYIFFFILILYGFEVVFGCGSCWKKRGSSISQKCV